MASFHCSTFYNHVKVSHICVWAVCWVYCNVLNAKPFNDNVWAWDQSLSLSYWTCNWVQGVAHGRVSAHGAMTRRIDPSWWTHWAFSHSNLWLTTGVTKVLSCLWDGAFGKSSLCSGGSWFPISLSEWSFAIYPLPYNHK